jgi:hypothetical protein
MYCPTCGSEERQLSQYCRACGTDLRSVRTTLEKGDAVTASAVLARDHISRAIADKIREAQSASELHKVAEDVLPEIEKFLESPEEKRLRRVRFGVVMSFIGIGASVGGVLASTQDPSLMVLLFPGAIAFFIGLAVMLNGILFTVPKKSLPEKPNDDWALPEALRSNASLDTSGFSSARESIAERNSVTEHTTKHLADKQTN